MCVYDHHVLMMMFRATMPSPDPTVVSIPEETDFSAPLFNEVQYSTERYNLLSVIKGFICLYNDCY